MLPRAPGLACLRGRRAACDRLGLSHTLAMARGK